MFATEYDGKRRGVRRIAARLSDTTTMWSIASPGSESILFLRHKKRHPSRVPFRMFRDTATPQRGPWQNFATFICPSYDERTRERINTLSPPREKAPLSGAFPSVSGYCHTPHAEKEGCCSAIATQGFARKEQTMFATEQRIATAKAVDRVTIIVFAIAKT